jgi:hypothetical protein
LEVGDGVGFVHPAQPFQRLCVRAGDRHRRSAQSGQGAFQRPSGASGGTSPHSGGNTMVSVPPV